jgi:hypothetical protein
MNRPPSLIIVAGLFILVGVGAAWQTIARSSPGHIFINPILLCLFVGIGLFRCRQIWRYIALICVWLLIITLLISTALTYMFPDGGDKFVSAWNALPLKTTGTSLGLLLALSVLIWMRWVLSRKDVYALFTSRAA